MIYILLFYEFFKIGLFSFGGGYATLPFLYRLSVQYDWYGVEELKHMTAISAITPGPVGINVATYAGYKTAGILGSFCATVAEIIPSLIIVIIISKMLEKFNNNFYVKTLISTLKPVSCALLISVLAGLLRPSLGDTKGLAILFLLLFLSIKTKRSPIFYFVIAAISGIIINSSFIWSIIKI